jgi:hypothetical protein
VLPDQSDAAARPINPVKRNRFPKTSVAARGPVSGDATADSQVDHRRSTLHGKMNNILIKNSKNIKITNNLCSTT